MKSWFFPVVLLMALCVAGAFSSATTTHDEWQLMVLGIAQDGGMPHPGCSKPPCSDVYAGRRHAEKVSCIGLVNRTTGAAYMFDATPDFPAQLNALTGGRPPDGIFLTHAHIGHYTGLMYLGKEAMATKNVPVYGTERMLSFLKNNGPWSALIDDARIEPRLLTPDQAVELPGGVRVTPILVPHRDEFSDTVGFLIEGPRRSALFIPDIDKWEKWDHNLRDMADRVDVLLVDGTFSSMSELPGRDIAQVPHPLMIETRALVKGTHAQLWFIHLNHSNPALMDATKDVVHEGQRFQL
ncbi:MAG TPA: MBL fold metallo-hydrolase [Candidatus Krumholzibacteria bacterium]|nr:MBL fold metallo-hydrolase [Candidatus Krumholzibacteria bacterium]